jgi:hypothetical protein
LRTGNDVRKLRELKCGGKFRPLVLPVSWREAFLGIDKLFCRLSRLQNRLFCNRLLQFFALRVRTAKRRFLQVAGQAKPASSELKFWNSLGLRIILQNPSFFLYCIMGITKGVKQTIEYFAIGAVLLLPATTVMPRISTLAFRILPILATSSSIKTSIITK